jgi:NADH-quinone oxidoreductase subunit L
MDHAAVLAPVVQVIEPGLLWIPGLPLAAFAVLILLGRRLGRASGWLAVASLVGALLGVVSIGAAVLDHQTLVLRWPWLAPADSAWAVGFAVDGLSWIMLLVVTTIAPLIACYSIGYMRDDPRFSRYFAYFALFCASMLLLVMADHFVLLYVGWELVGLCSYLLISFWFEKPAAAAAGLKAFLTTRVGDTGLLLGILLLAWLGGGLHFSALGAIRAHLLDHGYEGLLTLISLLVFLGAVGKSAQIPLHVWLPDAMEGPTPVSALIHAATMVAAGVYLVARTIELFTPASLTVVLAIGLSTHLLAGTVALTQTDIKRILAYSTLSQLGLMMTALGLGARSAAMLHLTTHAYFKALLFLGAGSVIHAAHTQELGRLGGLRRAMPWTATLFLLAALSMSGLMLLSGFWSKDAILLAAADARPWLLWVLLAGAVMTASYIFRLYLRCFHGTAPGHGHAHESPAVMVLPMALLGAGAACVGLLESPWLGHPFLRLLRDPHVHDHVDAAIAILSMVALAIGLWAAWTVGVKRRSLLPAAWRPVGNRLYQLAAHKYYVDEAYDRFLIQPFLAATGSLARFDQRVIDGAVNGAGRLGDLVARVKASFDRVVVDGFVNGLAAAVRGVGALLRLIQTGVVQQYLLVVAAAVVALSILGRR